MSFWILPDEEETAANVDAFLRGQIKRLERQAGMKLINLSSPQIPGMPTSSTSSNRQEERLQRGLNAMEALQAIRYTMERTYGISPQLLIKYYIKEESVVKIRRDLLIDHNMFPKLKKNALCQFADCWEQTQNKYDWHDRDRIDLRVFPKQKLERNKEEIEEKK